MQAQDGAEEVMIVRKNIARACTMLPPLVLPEARVRFEGAWPLSLHLRHQICEVARRVPAVFAPLRPRPVIVLWPKAVNSEVAADSAGCSS